MQRSGRRFDPGRKLIFFVAWLEVQFLPASICFEGSFGGNKTKSEKIPTGRKIETYHRYFCLKSDVAQGKSGGLIIRFGWFVLKGWKSLWGEVAKWSNAFG